MHEDKYEISLDRNFDKMIEVTFAENYDNEDLPDLVIEFMEINGEWIPVEIDVRFPYTDKRLPGLVSELLPLGNDSETTLEDIRKLLEDRGFKAA